MWFFVMWKGSKRLLLVDTALRAGGILRVWVAAYDWAKECSKALNHLVRFLSSLV